MQAFYTFFLKFCLALKSYKFYIYLPLIKSSRNCLIFVGFRIFLPDKSDCMRASTF